MKAYVYAVRGESEWRAVMSVAREVDHFYWKDEAFRQGAAAGWGEAAERVGETGGLHELVWLEKPIPLGISVSTRERLEAGINRSGGSVREEMLSSVRWAFERAGEPDAENGNLEIKRDFEKGMVGRRGNDTAWNTGFQMGKSARELADKLRGKQLLHAEVLAACPGMAADKLLAVLQLASLFGGVRLVSGVAPVGKTGGHGWRRKRVVDLRCRRCGSGETSDTGGEGAADGAVAASGGAEALRSPGLRRSPCASCGRRRCAYCEACLTMGRSRECGLLVIGAPSAALPAMVSPDSDSYLLSKWSLSPAQHEAAETALRFVRHRLLHREVSNARKPGIQRFLPFFSRERADVQTGTFLLWAVTGAGKTEMMFPLLEAVLSAGGRAAVAAPRRDVVLELAPRLAKAFPDARQAVLYGGSADRFEAGDLTLATTHQLIRFREAFDLVVIDEVDAFPYHNDRMLHFAASQSRACGGVTVLLSATPPAAMQRAARQGRLPHARVSVRFHRRPLPVPRRLNVPSAYRWASGRRMPAKLRAAIGNSLRRGAQVFLFVPYIRQVEPLVRCFRGNAAELGIDELAIEGTSSQDPDRDGKVSAFRARTIRLLITTTILERGVTIPKSDVFVLDADKPLFDAASLVQMAGRAGRSADDPDGMVYFAAPAWTIPQRDARRQIREMNAYARSKGYLL